MNCAALLFEGHSRILLKQRPLYTIFPFRIVSAFTTYEFYSPFVTVNHTGPASPFPSDSRSIVFSEKYLLRLHILFEWEIRHSHERFAVFLLSLKSGICRS